MGVAAYERGEARKAHANGFKNKMLLTRLGKLNFSVPQVREGASTRALWSAAAAVSEP